MKTLPILAIFVAGCSQALTSPSAPATADATMAAYQLHDQFSANEAAANRTFRGKWVCLYAPVGRVTTNPNGGYDVPLIGYGRHLVICQFSASAESDVANMPGSQVLGGQVEAAVIGQVKEVRHGSYTYWGDTLVVLENCQFRPHPVIPEHREPK